MVYVLSRFFQIYRFQSLGLILIFLFENIIEGLGITLIIPVFEKLFSEGTKTNILTKFIDSFFLTIGFESSTFNILFLIVCLFSIKAFLMLWGRRIIARTSSRFLQDFQTKSFNGMLEAEYAFYFKERIGDLTNALTQEVHRASVSFVFALQWISVCLSFILYLAFAFSISGMMTIGASLVAALCLSPLKLVTKRVEEYGVKTTLLNERLQNEVLEIFHGIKFIKGGAYEDLVKKRFFKTAETYRSNWENVYFFSNSIHVYSQPIIVLVLCSLLFVSKNLGLPIAEIIVFLVVFQRLLPTLTNLINIKNNLNATLPGFSKIDSILEKTLSFKEKDEGSLSGNLKGGIEIKNVSFSYDKNKTVLKNIDLKIKEGETIALLGPSGSGKTTLIDLILKFYRLQRGQILVGGVDLNDIKLESWRTHISYVPQDPILFHGTVSENIAWGNSTFSQGEIEKAATLSHAHEFIKSLNKGYETIVGDKGINLSGGQKQRIVLARALIKKPKILILDEATSSLDHESESFIKNSISKLKRNKDMTIIMVAHRLTTVKEADKIHVLKDGLILETGTWEELSTSDKSYISAHLTS